MEAILTVTRCVFLVCAWICISLWVMGTLLKNIASPQGDLTTDQSDVSIHERNSKPPYPGDTDKHLHIFVQISDLHISRYVDKKRTPDFEQFCMINILKVIQPEVVLMTGDLTDAKLPDKLGSRQFEDEWQLYHQVIQKTNVENHTVWLDIRGNHDAFDVPNLEDKTNFFSAYSSRGKHNKQSYKYVHRTTDGDEYSFIAVDSCPNPGPKRPFNFFGLIDQERLDVLRKYGEESKSSNMTVWFGHYPSSIVGGPEPGLTDILSQGAVYLCGHLHTLMGLVPRMYTAHSNGNLELELGDWMDNRRYRVFAVDHDLFSFTDEQFKTWPVILVTNPKSAELVMSKHEPFGRMAQSTHIRLVVFSDAAVEHVEVSIDGEEKQVAHKSASNLYVVPWQPSRYSMGLHHMTVTAKDSAGRSRTIIHTFSLDNSRSGFDIRGRFVLMTDFITLFKCLFGLSLFICVLPIIVMKICHRRIFFAVDGKWSGVFASFLQCWLRRMYLLSITNTISYPLLFFHLYIALGPWFIGEMLHGQYGACFVFGIYVHGVFIPGTLSYCYGVCQLLLFNLPLMLYLGRLIDVSLSDHRTNLKPVSFWTSQVVKTLLDIGVFTVFVGWQFYLAVWGFNRAYSRMALIMCPTRTWSVVLAWYLRRVALYKRNRYVTSDPLIT